MVKRSSYIKLYRLKNYDEITRFEALETAFMFLISRS